eukprot:TRINITY_DN43877_c0_g1_i1.p1 TRINITY_DN43877_c0_g1~~TRINITY_DN43877_c0_g1_i1.p1  ORF type:complete len:307 (+),score=99.81 TRINITY_DN43877_c0_g1_i1:81-923(+)
MPVAPEEFDELVKHDFSKAARGVEDVREAHQRGPASEALPERLAPLTVCPHPRCIPELRPSKGTTTLGFKFKDGVVLAVDSRATQGAYIASRSVQKVIPSNEYLLGTMAGGAADCQYWFRVLGREARLWELRNKHKITVSAASKLMSNILYSHRNHGLSVGSMIAGWDKHGPNLYYVDDSGKRLKGPLFSAGSGSIFAYGILDQGYSHDMSTEEAIQLARRAVFHAGHRDGMSGGLVQVYLVHPPKEDGSAWTKISRDSVDELYDKYVGDGTMHKVDFSA